MNLENLKTKAKEKVEKETEKVKKGLKTTKDFFIENPQIIPVLFSGLGMLLAGGAKIISSNGKNRLDSCKVKDDVTEEFFLTEHPMTNDEILELSSRMVDGQTKGEALNEMGLLRNEKRRK